jgi:propionyl-CoA synthetase
LYTAPTTIRAIKKEDFSGDLINKYDLSHFEGFHLAGERMDPDT